MKRRLPPSIAGALVVLSALFVFHHVLRNHFVDWDDDILIYANPYIRGLDFLHFRWMLTSTLNSAWQPLGWLLYGIIYGCAGLRPWAYHAVSLGLHLIATALVFALGLELLAGETIAAALAALLFAVHPLQVESVAWAACMADLLCCAFCLGSVLAYVKFMKGQRKIGLFRLSIALAVAAALSRWEAAALPAVLIVLDEYVLSRRIEWGIKIPFFFVSMGVGAANAIAKMSVMHYESVPRSPMTAALGALELLGHVVFPVSLRPVYFLTDSSRPFGFSAFEAAIIISGLSVLLFLFRKKRPGAWAAWLCFGALLLPVMSVSREGPVFMHDRYAYLPLACFALLVGVILKRRVWARVLGIFLVAGWSALSITQAGVWYDGESLWKHVVAVDPQESLAYYDLGEMFLARGRTYEAVYYLREQARHNPEKGRANWAHALNDLGVEMAQKGRWEEAQKCLGEAVDLDPATEQSRRNLELVRQHLQK